MSQCPCRRCNDQNLGHSASCHMYLSLTECMTHISHPNLWAEQDHKHTHPERSHWLSTSCLIIDQYFICSPLLLRCWLASLPKGGSSGTYTHTHRLPETPSTHTKLLRAVVCFDWRVGHAVLTPHWHSIPFWHIAVYQLLWAKRYMFQCVFVCVLNASRLSSLHTLLILLSRCCLDILSHTSFVCALPLLQLNLFAVLFYFIHLFIEGGGLLRVCAVGVGSVYNCAQTASGELWCYCSQVKMDSF